MSLLSCPWPEWEAVSIDVWTGCAFRSQWWRVVDEVYECCWFPLWLHHWSAIEKHGMKKDMLCGNTQHYSTRWPTVFWAHRDYLCIVGGLVSSMCLKKKALLSNENRLRNQSCQAFLDSTFSMYFICSPVCFELLFLLDRKSSRSPYYVATVLYTNTHSIPWHGDLKYLFFNYHLYQLSSIEFYKLIKGGGGEWRWVSYSF